MKYPLNPNCSPLKVAKGKNLFIYFTYAKGNIRKIVKFRKGLNDNGITAKELKTRISQIFNEVEKLLYTKMFNGVDFEDKSDVIKIPTFAEAAEVYIQNRIEFVTSKTIENYKNGFDFFSNYLFLRGISDLTIDKIDALLLEDYISYMLKHISLKTKRKLSIQTINEYKDRVSFVLKFYSKKKRLLPYNPMEDVTTGKKLQKQDSLTHKAMSVEEFTELIEYVKKHRKPAYLTFLLLIYYTHLRPMEICRLQIKDFDMEKRIINLIAPKSKTRISRTVYLDLPIYNHLLSIGVDFNQDLNSYFISYSSLNRIGYVGERLYNHNNISYSFKTIMADLGYSEKGFTKYGLKHTANVHEVIYENMSFAEVQIRNGHTMPQQTQTYLRNLKEFYTPSLKDRNLKFDI